MDSVGFRATCYAGLTLLAGIVAGALGAAYFDSSCDPNDPEVTECDLGGVYAFVSALYVMVGCAVVAVVTEVALVFRRWSRPRPPHAGR